MPIDWIKTAYAEGSIFAAFDIETTGLDPRKDRIVEIAAIKFDKRGIIARFSTLINPGIPMPAEASRVNNITDDMLMGKPALDEVLPDFLKFIKGSIMAAHNAPFDCSFINEKLSTRMDNPMADTLVISRELFPGYRSYSLQNLSAALGISAQNAHRAEDDARLCMEILMRCIGAA